jgi:tRNA A37 methylthiotransferase MiaB
MMNPRTVLPLKGQISEMYLQPKVFKFLHLPVQSASETILHCMAREYTVSDFETIVETVRSRVPHITLSTDLIVGYPGETNDDHLRNLEMIQKIRPDIVNVTRFSSRPGTKAADADRKVVGWMAKDRSREITELRFRIAKERNEAWIGCELPALATERGKGNSTIFRSDEYNQIVVKERFDLGGYHIVKINDATPTYLIGSVGDRG